VDTWAALAAVDAQLAARVGRCGAPVSAPRCSTSGSMRWPRRCVRPTRGPASPRRADALIPAELVAELAETAQLRPLFDAAAADPEPGYRPSAQLAEFVRARDLTWRAPGCDRPAAECDIDHTIAFSDGGAHASTEERAHR
jgi:Domain of unknown function (DUF222)